MLIAFVVSVSKDSMSMCPNRQNSEKGVRLHRDRVQGWPSLKKVQKEQNHPRLLRLCHNEPPSGHSFT